MGYLKCLSMIVLLVSCQERNAKQEGVKLLNQDASALNYQEGADPYFVKDKKIDFSNGQNFNRDLQEFRDGLSVFIDNNGHAIAHTKNFAKGADGKEKYLHNNFFFGNLNTLWQMEQQGGRSGSLEDGRYEQMIVFNDKKYPDSEIRIIDKVLTVKCGEKTAQYMPADKQTENLVKNQVVFTPLPPDARSLVWLFKFKDQPKYIYVDAAKYNSAEYRLYIGKAGSMVRKEINGMIIIGNGSVSHYIGTVDGDKLTANGHTMPGASKWNDQELVKLSHLSDLSILGVPLGNRDSQLITPCESLHEGEKN